MNDLPLDPNPMSIMEHLKRIKELGEQNRKLRDQMMNRCADTGGFFQVPVKQENEHAG